MRPRVRPSFVVALTFVACFTLACGMTVRDTIRTTALVTATAVLDVDQAERDLFATGAYSAEKHKQIGALILKALEASKVFVSAAQSWPESFTMPSTVPQAMADALKALDAIKDALTGFPGTGKLLANVEHAKFIISGGDKK